MMKCLNCGKSLISKGAEIRPSNQQIFLVCLNCNREYILLNGEKLVLVKM